MPDKKRPAIPMNPVKSSNLSQCGHCEETDTLSVTFKHGGTYHFANVPKKVADNFMGSKSVGKSFHSMIKGKYESFKVA